MKFISRFLIVLSLILLATTITPSKQTLAYQSMSVNPITNESTEVTGKAKAGGTVYVYVGEEYIASADVYDFGFYVSIPKIKAGKKVSIYYLYKGVVDQQVDTIVKDVIPPSHPDIDSQLSTTSGFILGSGEKGAIASAFKGNKKIGAAIVDKYGSFAIPISAQKSGTTIKVNLKDKSGNLSSGSYVTVTQSSVKPKKQLSLKMYTDLQKLKITQEFYSWAGQQAKAKKQAVTDIWFNHGAGGRGDWYADTPHGEAQVQDLNNPGYYGFGIHALGGVVFYTPVDGKYGASNDVANEPTFAGYSNVSKKNSYIKKYLLGDNGVVYEVTVKREKSYFGTGTAEYTDKGVRGKYVPDVKFKVSSDTMAQKKLKSILKKY